MSDIKNPWRLTARQADVIDALCETGSRKGAALHLGLSDGAVKDHVERIRTKMQAEFGDHYRYILRWDRWRQSEGKGIAA